MGKYVKQQLQLYARGMHPQKVQLWAADPHTVHKSNRSLQVVSHCIRLYQGGVQHPSDSIAASHRSKDSVVEKRGAPGGWMHGRTQADARDM